MAGRGVSSSILPGVDVSTGVTALLQQHDRLAAGVVSRTSDLTRHAPTAITAGGATRVVASPRSERAGDVSWLSLQSSHHAITASAASTAVRPAIPTAAARSTGHLRPAAAAVSRSAAPVASSSRAVYTGSSSTRVRGTASSTAARTAVPKSAPATAALSSSVGHGVTPLDTAHDAISLEAAVHALERLQLPDDVLALLRGRLDQQRSAGLSADGAAGTPAPPVTATQGMSPCWHHWTCSPALSCLCVCVCVCVLWLSQPLLLDLQALVCLTCPTCGPASTHQQALAQRRCRPCGQVTKRTPRWTMTVLVLVQAEQL